MNAGKNRKCTAEETDLLTEWYNCKEKRRIIVHVPHAGDELSPELAESAIVPLEELKRQHNALKDSYVAGIIPDFTDDVIAFPLSRIFCDVERFTEGEPMEKYGMGFCYSHGFDGTEIKRVTPALLDKTMEYYAAHHSRFSEICRSTGKMLVIDLHSYSREIVPSEYIPADRVLPDICIGFDNGYFPSEYVDFAITCFEDRGFTVDVNYPYCGSFVPSEVMRDPGSFDCLSVMVEINRDVFRRAENENYIADVNDRITAAIEDIILFTAPKDISG